MSISDFLKRSMMNGSSQSLDSPSGILFPNAFFKIKRSLSNADLFIYFTAFCCFKRGLITEKKLVDALSRANLKASKSLCAFIFLFSICLMRFLSSSSSFFISGCLEDSLHASNPRHGSFGHLALVCPRPWQFEQIFARFSA